MQLGKTLSHLSVGSASSRFGPGKSDKTGCGSGNDVFWEILLLGSTASLSSQSS